jgi:hypothetical protein
MRRGWTWRGLYGGADVAALSARAETSPAAPFRCATAGAFHEYHPLYLLANDLETADGYAVIYPDRYPPLLGAGAPSAAARRTGIDRLLHPLG